MILKNLLAIVIASSALSVAAKEKITDVATAGKQIVFMENKGQVTDQYRQLRPDVQFALHLKGVNAFIGSGQIHYQFSKMPTINADQDRKLKLFSQDKATGPVEMYRMDVELLGANTTAKAEALEQTPYFENYYLPQCGKDGASAHSYSKIVYHDVYPNIDWVLKIKDGQPEYEFVVKAGGKPANIRIKYNGATDIRLNKNGSLTAVTPLGSITEEAPYSYEEDGRTVNSSFNLKDNVLSFNIDNYNGTLIIDRATYYGGSDYEYGNDVSCDNLRNVYLTGETASTANIATVGAYQIVNLGGNTYHNDAYVVKFNSSGTRQWASYFGGNDDDQSIGVSCDGANNIYITGYTYSSSNIATPGSYQTTLSGTSDGFIAKFSNAGARIWATYYGGNNMEGFNGIKCDHFGCIFLTGQTESTIGIASAGAYQTTFGGGNWDAFVVKFDSAGHRKWGSYFGGPGDEYGYGITCDELSNVYISGGTQSSTGIATINCHQPTFGGPGLDDAFLAKFDSTGASQWATYYGGTGADFGYSVACDDTGNVFMAGETTSDNNIATPGCFQPIRQVYDEFIVKFNASGTRKWGTYFGGDFNERDGRISCDGLSIYLTGHTYTTSNFSTPGMYQSAFGGTIDAFLAKFDNSGSRIWCTYYGGSLSDYGLATACDIYGLVYVAGYTNSTSAIATAGAHQTTFGGGANDAFLFKFDGCTTAPAQAQPIIGNLVVCAGSTQHYSVPIVTGASAYSWFPPVGWTVIGNTNSIDVIVGNTGGTLSVVSTNDCGSSMVQSITVTVNPTINATASISTPNTTICSGTQVTYTATTNIVGGSYQWQVNNVNAGGNSSTFTYTPNNGEQITCIITGAAGSCYTPSPVTSNVITMTVNPTIVPSVSISGNATVCTGASVTYTATGNVVGATYQWQVNNTNAGGNSTTYSYTPANGDLVRCIVTAPQGCYTPSADTSNVITMTVNPYQTPTISITAPPSVPAGQQVTANATINNAGPTYSIDWKNNAVSFATTSVPSTTYTKAAGTDNITATITSPGCYNPATSNNVSVAEALAVNELSGRANISLYPNPNTGTCVLKGSTSASDDQMDIVITDLAGRVILQDVFTISGGIVNKQVTMPANVPAGSYILKATTQSGNVVIPFTKE